MITYIFIDIYMMPFSKKIKRKTEAQASFLIPFTVCSYSKRKFVACPFVDKETN
jgi:ribosomal protein L11